MGADAGFIVTEFSAAIATETVTAAGETTGVSSQWTFGSMAIWGGVAVLVLYLLYRRFGS